MTADELSANLREELADWQHAIWAHWMSYLFGVCQHNEDGSVTIPADKVERWMRQQVTPYSALTEEERESDREQADKILAVLQPMLRDLAAMSDHLADLHTGRTTETNFWRWRVDNNR